jgi:plastocyanin
MTRRGRGLHSAIPAVVVAIAVLAPLGLAACGGSGGSKSEPTKTVTNGAITVEAFDSLHFDVGTIKTAPGPLTVTLVNKGAIEHTLKIDGTPLLLKTNGGKSATGRVTLAKGTYVFECTIPGHAAQGMKGTVVVS